MHRRCRRRCFGRLRTFLGALSPLPRWLENRTRSRRARSRREIAAVAAPCCRASCRRERREKESSPPLSSRVFSSFRCDARKQKNAFDCPAHQNLSLSLAPPSPCAPPLPWLRRARRRACHARHALPPRRDGLGESRRRVEAERHREMKPTVAANPSSSSRRGRRRRSRPRPAAKAAKASSSSPRPSSSSATA